MTSDKARDPHQETPASTAIVDRIQTHIENLGHDLGSSWLDRKASLEKMGATQLERLHEEVAQTDDKDQAMRLIQKTISEFEFALQDGELQKFSEALDHAVTHDNLNPATASR